MCSPVNESLEATRVSRRKVLCWLMAAGSACTLRARDAQAGEAFVVVVHPDNPHPSVSRTFLAQAFLKKTSRWEDGEGIYPVDRGAGAPVRRAFSEEVLSRSVAAVRSYWQQRIFSGRGVPPPEVASDEAVVAFVRRRRGAVGYVSPGAALQGVKVLQVR